MFVITSSSVIPLKELGRDLCILGGVLISVDPETYENSDDCHTCHEGCPTDSQLCWHEEGKRVLKMKKEEMASTQEAYQIVNNVYSSEEAIENKSSTNKTQELYELTCRELRWWVG